MRVPKSRFVTLSEDKIELVRNWRNKPRVRDNSIDNSIISAQDQQVWFEGVKARKDCFYFLFLQDDKPIGMLSFTDIDGVACKWGCYIGEDAVWPGSGLILEVAALDYAFDVIGVELLVAEVFEHNKGPIRMCRFFEYEEAGLADAASGPNASRLLKFVYARKNWVERRRAVLRKLPKQIQVALEQIEYE